MSNLFKPWCVNPAAPTQTRVIDSNAIMAEHLQKNNRPVPVREGTGETPGGFADGITEGQDVLTAQEAAAGSGIESRYLEKAKEEAEAVLAQAKEEAKAAVAKAEGEAEQIRANAREEGYAQGAKTREKELENLKRSLQMDYDGRKQELKQDYDEKCSNMEKDLVDAILPVFEKVFQVSFSGDKEILLHLIQNTILHIEGEKKFRIRAAEENIPYLEEHKEDILKRVGHDVELEMAVDSSLGEDDCMIETDSGIFECGQGIQLENLTKKNPNVVFVRANLGKKMAKEYDKYLQLAEETYFNHLGKVVKIVGLTIESVGPNAKLGDLCQIMIDRGRGITAMAEVVGFREKRLLLMPFENVEGIGVGCLVENTGRPLSIAVGPQLLGHTLDGIGRPTDGEVAALDKHYPVDAPPPDPMARKIISEVLPLGVKAVDGLITVGKGQRIGIFAGSGVGKSTLLGMFARNTKADINVIALIGERGREVREFVERDLGEEGMKRSIVVVATSDKPALIRRTAAKTATAIAEYFRDEGKDVLLMMDSLTRFSMAQREIGLASGEPPVTRGYPPSVYSEMPKLLERAGTSATGSITGLYTVLVDGDDFNEPITDTARSILDGHIMLDRKLGHKNHYPAIDILQSISRVMSSIATSEHKELAGKLKNVLATYHEAEDLINIGAYKNGSNREIDYAIQKIDAVNAYLCQKTDEKFDFKEEIELLRNLFKD